MFVNKHHNGLGKASGSPVVCDKALKAPSISKPYNKLVILY